MRVFFKLLVTLLIVAALAASAALWWWPRQPLELAGVARLEFEVPAGASMRTAAQQAVKAGVQTRPELLYWFFRLAGRGQVIQQGTYEVAQGMNAHDLLDKLVRGNRIELPVTLLEGWTFQQVRQALARADGLKNDSAAFSDEALMRSLGKPGVAPEGRFFPDTYRYAKNSSDMNVLRRAMRLMDERLAAAWARRAPDLPLQTPEQALILASIIEKETGLDQDRALVAGVFNNRLRAGMPLQTDPTVIYGMGSHFDGNLRKRDLQTDTPYNTYTRRGLPPTPIAMPGKASLMAAVQPANTMALYFVARGDGSSHFSSNLAEHNAAVRRYQLGSSGAH
ncbi:MAG: endolytic transglycosylase MltG [Burkholderiaceae bacterium]|nr:endolytic transglycosylase MltG [Burkholderiaceae bacterium]